MKKKLSVFLCTLMCVALASTGCSSGEAEKKADKSGQQLANATVSAPKTFPIVKEKKTLKILSTGEDFEKNEFLKWYEDYTNVHVEWELVPATAAQEKLQVKVASSDLPDVFNNMGIGNAQAVTYGGQGIIIPLNDLIEKYGPNIKRMFEKAPIAKRYAYTPDGNAYTLPMVNESTTESIPKKAWVYKPWLDKLGISMPTTLDEYYDMLVAFKTKDPNGNGKADEVPMAGANPEKNANNEIESFLMQSFLFYDRGTFLSMNGDKVEFDGDKPAYKEGLRYLRKLFSADLIAKDSFIQDRKALTALTENEENSRLGVAMAFYVGHFTVENGPKGRFKEFTTIPPLKGPDGTRRAFDRGTQVLAGKFAISRNCKIPEVAIRWVDWFYNNEEMLASGFHAGLGKEGEGWKKATADQKGIDGRPATYERLIPLDVKTDKHFGLKYPAYENLDFIFAQAASEATSYKEVVGSRETKEKYLPYAVNKVIPNLFYSEDQLAKSGDLKTNVKKVTDTFFVKFVTGTLDIDKDWDTYVKELKNAKVDEYVKVTQEAYDLNNKKK